MKIKSEFTKNVLTMMTGSGVAQAIPILVAPLLTRMYAPEEFALLFLFITFNGILTIIAMGKYDLALMLPKEDEDAINVLGLSLNLTLFISIFIMCIVILFNKFITNLLNSPDFSLWLYFLPVSVFFFGVYQTLCSWLNRKRRYVMLASSNVTLKMFSELTKLGIGASRKTTAFFTNGLIIGYFFGILSASSILIWQFVTYELKKIKFINLYKMSYFAKVYKKFPMYNVPYSLINGFSQGFMVIALTSFGHLLKAGYFGFVKSVMFLPISFLSVSLSRVFYKEAAVHYQKPKLERLAVKLTDKIALIFTPAFVFFIFWHVEIFKYLFGNQWIEAGKYAAIFSPVSFLFLFTSWPERIFEVAQKQQIVFFIQLFSDIIIISTIWSLLYLGFKPLTAIIVYSVISCCYHLVYLIAAFKVGQFHLFTLIILFKKVFFIAITISISFVLIKYFVVSILLQFTISILIIFLYYIKITYDYLNNKEPKITPRN